MIEMIRITNDYKLIKSLENQQKEEDYNASINSKENYNIYK